MVESFWNLAGFGVGIGLVGLIAGFFVLVFKLGTWYEGVKTSQGNVGDLKSDVTEVKGEVRVLKGDVSGLKSDVSELKSDVAELKKDTSKLKQSVLQLERHVFKVKESVSLIISLLSNTGPSTMMSSGPLALNPLGKKVSKKLDTPTLVSGLAKKLASEAAGLTEFDIQEMSRKRVNAEFGSKPTVEMKECAYEHGIGMHAVLDVLAIVLRDQLLSRKGKDKS